MSSFHNKMFLRQKIKLPNVSVLIKIKEIGEKKESGFFGLILEVMR